MIIDQVQFILEPFLKLKKREHKLYEIIRKEDFKEYVVHNLELKQIKEEFFESCRTGVLFSLVFLSFFFCFLFGEWQILSMILFRSLLSINNMTSNRGYKDIEIDAHSRIWY